MSHFSQKIKTEYIYKNKNKIISKSYKTRKNSKLINNNYRNNSLFNITPKEKNIPYKINYANTEANNSSNNLKNPTHPNFKKLNEIQLDPPALNIHKNNFIKKSENNINKYRIISANLLKTKKRYSSINTNINNKKEAQIYLNAFVDESISESNQKRIQSTRGFIRKAEAETEKIMKNKSKIRNFPYKSGNHVKNLNLNFHRNYFKYGYVTTEKNQNLKKKDIYFDLLTKYKIANGIEIPKKLKNKEDRDNYLISIINNLTRKVQFLNTKNDILSNENTMNLLNKEEYFLYQKLKEYFKNNYSIKKFSKSIFDFKNGNKYLLPLFNNINFSNSNNEEKNKNELNKFDDGFKQDNNIINHQNDIKEKKIMELYFNNNQFSNQKNDNNINNIYFPSMLDKLNLQSQNQRIIKLNKSYDRINNLQKLYNISNNNKQIIVLNKSNRQALNEEQFYQEYKMKIIKENENIINNYHKKANNSTNELLSKKQIHKNSVINNFIPIKKRPNKIVEEVKNFNEENIFKSNRNKNAAENLDSKHKKIKISNSERKQLLKNKENNKVIKVNKSKEKIKGTNKINKNNGKLITNNSKTKDENNAESGRNAIARLSTKNIGENSLISKTNKVGNNDDIKNLLNKDNNIFSDFERIYRKNKINNSGTKNNKNPNNDKEKVINKEENKIEKIKTQKNPEKISKTKDIEKKEENNLNPNLRTITISNNMILRENLKKEDTKLVVKIEKKKNKILKLLYSYLKEHLKDLIQKDQIKLLLQNPEFKKNFDLLKSQINQINKLTNSNSPEAKKPVSLSDDDIINILYEEVNSQSEKKVVSHTKKSSYIPLLHLKKRLSQIKENEEKKEEKKEEPRINKNLEKENEKLELMANEISLSNELKQHIRETYNKEFRARFQVILEKVESYQELNTADYVETFKSNYYLLKEEMNQVLRDKEREERINSFMNNLDSERNIFENKWIFCSNKISVFDNKFEISLGRYQNIKHRKKKNK